MLYTLTEIHTLLQLDCYATFEDSILQKEEELKIESKAIEHRLNLINHLKQANHVYQASKEKHGIEIVNFPQRYCYTFNVQQNIYQMEIESYEYHLRLFKKHLQEERYPFLFSCIGSILNKENFVNGIFYSDLMFIIIPERLNTMSNYSLPAGNYAVTYCDAFDKELCTLKTFREKIATLGYQISGDYICEVIYEWSPLADQKRNMFIRLQLPISETG